MWRSMSWVPTYIVHELSYLYILSRVMSHVNAVKVWPFYGNSFIAWMARYRSEIQMSTQLVDQTMVSGFGE